MPTDGLLIIAPVKEGKEGALRATLNRLGNDIRGVRTSAAEPRIELAESRSIHFARLALLADPDRGPGRERLLFATDYDGPLDAHVREVIALTHEPEAIWGCCEGYEDPASFPEFIRRHSIVPDTYYIAFRGDDLERLRASIELREWFQAWLRDPRAERIFESMPGSVRLCAALRRLWRAVVLPLDVARRALLAAIEIAVLLGRLGPREVWRAALQINATLDRVWWIRPFNVLSGNELKPPPHRYSQAALEVVADPTPPGHPPEDAVLQNQLTLVTDVRPEQVPRLRAVLALIDLFGRRLATPGSLVGISTIHTVRWTLIDGGRRLLMVSNYDGTWENYIDEFAEMILSGLDALWSSAPDYPLAGAQDLAAFKQFLRTHQAPANVFYSAYPAASVLNLIHDLEGARWLAAARRRVAGQSPELVTPAQPAR